MDVSGRGAYIFDDKTENDRECILCGKHSEGLFCNKCNLRFTLLNTEKALELFNLIVYKLEELVDEENE